MQSSLNSNDLTGSPPKDSSGQSKKTGQVTYVKVTKEDLESLTELQQDLKLMRQHNHILRTSSDFFKRIFRPPNVSVDDVHTAEGLISRAILSTDEFLASFQDLETNMVDLNSCLEDSDKFPDMSQSLSTSKMSKDLAVMKALKAHEDATSAFQFVLDSQNFNEIGNVVREQEVLKRKLQDYENHLMSRGSQLMNMEKELSLSQGRQKSLEAKIVHLETELDHRENQIDKMKLSLNDHTTQVKSLAENEKLILIIEEIQSKNEEEKDVLKRALNHQTSRAENDERNLFDFEQKLAEQEHVNYQLAVERDRWKAEMTALNNKYIELDNQRLTAEAKISALKSQIVASNSSELLMEQLKKALEEKDGLLESASAANNSLKEEIISLDSLYKRTLKDLKELEKSFKKYKSSSQLALKEAREAVNGSICSVEKVDRSTDTRDVLREMDHGIVDGSICSVKKVDRSTETRDGLREMERSLKNLQEKYDAEIKEKEKLKSRLDILESKLQDSNVRKVDSETFSQIHVPTWPRNYDYHVAEEELGSQVTVNEADLIRLEDHLKDKDRRLKNMEKCSLELENKYASQIGELKSNLDRISLSYGNLQKYVKLLRSSYTSVFGSV